MKKLIAIALVILLSGCNQDNVRCDPEIIEVPVVVHVDPPEPANVPEPELDIDTVVSDTPGKEVVRAYLATIIQLETVIKQLRASLEPYQKKGTESDVQDK